MAAPRTPAPSSPRDIAQQMLLVLQDVTSARTVELHHPQWGELTVGEPSKHALPTLTLHTPDGLGQIVLQGEHLKHIEKDVHRAQSYVETILNLSRLMASESGIQDLLKQALEVLQESIQMDLVFVLKMNREGYGVDEVLSLGTASIPEDVPQQLFLGGSIAWEALRTQHPKHHPALPAASGPVEVMVFPLHLREGEGRILVVGRQQGTPWLPEERTLLESMALGIRMVHQQGEYVRHLRDVALIDALTGLANRRAFESDLEDALQDAQHRGLSLGVMVLDLDGLKKVNDQQGHERGDALLRTFGEALKQHLRQSDPAYRLGGDEFAVILKNLQPGQLSILETRLASIRSTVRQKGFAEADASAGVAFLGRDGETPGELCRVADERMYAQKAVHKNHQQASLLGSVSPRAAWQTLRSTLELLSHDQEAGPKFWRTLLQAAIQTIPSVEAGSMDVCHEGYYVVAAQVGYEDEILGIQLSEDSQLKWYGKGRDNYLKGVPRLLYGLEIARHSSATIEHDKYEVFDDAGSLAQVKSTILLPIVVDGHPIAHMNLDNHTVEQAFSQEAIEIAMDFAAQVAALLLAQQRREIIAEREHHMKLLQDFTREVLHLQSEAERLESLRALAMQLLNTHQVTLDENPQGKFSLRLPHGYLNAVPEKGDALSRSGREHLGIAALLLGAD
ncbi:GGDEF domain-containing protein [Deinococcus cellulosilyticus]|uniref:GGDEF domain-containing protein n=1 Tax=Deinococcus cellulosilyticus (strain DSM 18568 / NBRC 106333 / KACC 11606 / 5516J-15) TaxID=1223518 RepID=A0A511N982_DEIC1|nr:GGDEF domain-containing protein [Deinococcus cellulosilyticus]GEM49038.1 hypothetical protein DC3_46730 [Deinococcus cellulosilyticus NBRC 106333 = KACC 11606]